MSHLFSPLTLRSVTIPNRVVMSPMCMYSSVGGFPNQWHFTHLGSRAAGGVGLVIVEATAVTPVGRITPGDLGIWSDAHAEALAPIARFIAERGAIPGIQLAHAGRKAGRTLPWGGNTPIPAADWGRIPGPSALPFQDGWQTPEPMDEDAIEQVAADFAAATKRAVAAGFQVVEGHFAHGYLLHEFLSPLSNKRNDRFGGDLEGRARAPLRVVSAMREALPEDLPLFVRLSLVDWAEGGITLEETIQVASWMKALGVDLLDCSSGSVVPGETVPSEPGYHAPMTREVRTRAGIPTGAVGLITEPDHAESLIAEGAADVVLLARALLRNPYWARAAADALGVINPVEVPIQYRRAVEQRRRAGR